MASENSSPVATPTHIQQSQQIPTEEVKQLQQPASKPAILLVPDPRKTVRPGHVTYSDDFPRCYPSTEDALAASRNLLPIWIIPLVATAQPLDLTTKSGEIRVMAHLVVSVCSSSLQIGQIKTGRSKNSKAR